MKISRNLPLLFLFVLGCVGCSLTPSTRNDIPPINSVEQTPRNISTPVLLPTNAGSTPTEYPLNLGLFLEGTWNALDSDIELNFTARGSVNRGIPASYGQTSYCLGTWSTIGENTFSIPGLRITWSSLPPNCLGGADTAILRIIDDQTIAISVTASETDILTSGTYRKE